MISLEAIQPSSSSVALAPGEDGIRASGDPVSYIDPTESFESIMIKEFDTAQKVNPEKRRALVVGSELGDQSMTNTVTPPIIPQFVCQIECPSSDFPKFDGGRDDGAQDLSSGMMIGFQNIRLKTLASEGAVSSLHLAERFAKLVSADQFRTNAATSPQASFAIPISRVAVETHKSSDGLALAVGSQIATTLVNMIESPSPLAHAVAHPLHWPAQPAFVNIVRIQLDPEQLGTVEIRMKFIGKSVEVNMAPDRESTSMLLRAESHWLASALTAIGHDVGVVQVSNPSGIIGSNLAHGGFSQDERPRGDSTQGSDRRKAAWKPSVQQSESSIAYAGKHSAHSDALRRGLLA